MRFRTVGDITCTAPVESDADTPGQDPRRDGDHHDHRARRHADGRPDLGSVDGATQEGRVFLRRIRARPAANPHSTEPPTSCLRNYRTHVANPSPDIDNGLLRFLTCGSVDDGKSTLIGRLLFDTKTILADTLNAIEKPRPSAA